MLKLLLYFSLIVASVASAEDDSSWAVTVERGVLLHQPRNAESKISKLFGQANEFAIVRNKEGITDQLSAVIEPDIHAGAGWYGVLGLLKRSHLKEECWIIRPGKEGCAVMLSSASDRGRSQTYAGGGMRYRVAFGEKWAGVGMLGITYTGGQNTEQFPRHHLYHLGLRLEYSLTSSWAGTLGYHHLSNGYQLHLPGGERPNGGIDRLSLGLQYRF